MYVNQQRSLPAETADESRPQNHAQFRSVPGRKRDDGPLAVPRPPPLARIAAAALLGPELLVDAGLEADDDIGLAGAQGEDVDTGAGAEGT